MKKEVLEKKLDEIAKEIKSQFENEKDLGILGGLSGIAIFQFYYAKYLNKDDVADLGVDILGLSIERINDGYGFPTFCTGIAGLGWAFDHLRSTDFIDLDTDELLQDFDDYLYQYMLRDLKHANYDFLHGAIGYAVYFLNRFRNTNSKTLKEKYRNFLSEFITLLEDLSDNIVEGKRRWLSVLNRDTQEKGYNLSLSHGMSSIVGILTKLHEHKEFRTQVESMLKGAINYLLSFKNEGEDSFCMFPNSIAETGSINKKSRLAWCYGDLGVGVRIWYAAKSLGDKNLKNTSLSILKHASKRVARENTMVIDAGVCHGSFGNAQIFNRMYKETADEDFKTAADFWISDGLQKAIFEDGYAGYKQWKANEDGDPWSLETNMLEGITGIGLTIIDYLSNENNTWDECLMIS